MRLKVDQRPGQLSLPHLGITKTEKIELKHKTDEQISPVNSLEPWDQSDRSRGIINSQTECYSDGRGRPEDSYSADYTWTNANQRLRRVEPRFRQHGWTPPW